MEKINTRKKQGINTRKKIINRAIELINDNGYENVTVQDICTSLDLTIGAFYHHFKSKDDIVIETLKEHDDFYENESQAFLTSESIFDNIITYLTLLPQRVVKDTGLDMTRTIYCVVLTTESNFPLSYDRSIARKLIELIETAQKSNVLVDTESPIVIQDELLTITRGIIYNWAEAKGSYDLVEKVEKLCRNYLKCYLK